MKTITRAEFSIVGMEYVGTAKDGGLAPTWDSFAERMDDITNAVDPDVFYGLCSDFDPATGKFSYIAGIEVTDLNNIPKGMAGTTIPAQTYLVVTHKGQLNGLSKTWESAYKLMAENGYCAAGNFGLEYYDDRFDPASPDSELDIYVPVKPKG